jgi:hypothetical protein
MAGRAPLDVCRACPLARCRGACACTVSGRPIEAHAAAGECPRGWFAAPPAGLGQAVPAGYDPATSPDSPKQCGCCDPPRAD